MLIKINHNEWSDELLLNFSDNRLRRISVDDEMATFELKNNILVIKWDKWDEEIFIYNGNNSYNVMDKYNFVHNDWEDICYLDKLNNIIYRKLDLKKGTFEYINDELLITWNNDNENELNNKIPNIIHFVYGFKEQKDEFELYRYIAIKSAYEVNKPDKIYFHYYYEPFGYYWDKIKPLLTLDKIEPPDNIYSNNVYHYAHKADIVRLQKLIEYGGIYLDIDTICLKSFGDLLDNDFVMGTQMNANNKDIYGLCNAVILSKPNSKFALKWLESYKSFKSMGRDEYWDEHSVLMPYELSKYNMSDIKIINSNAFFYPLWNNIEEILFTEKYDREEYKKLVLNNYCIHLWDTYSHKILKNLNEDDLLNKNTLYNIISRKFIKNNISIVFLTYNRLDKIKKCLESFLKSLDRDDIIELLILDNNSDLETIEYLKQYQELHYKIKIIFLNENVGVCHGRIILYEEAIGDIIVSLDSDVFLINESFFNRITNLLYDESYGIIGISGAYIKGWEFGQQYDIPETEPNELCVHHIAGCCQVFRKDLKIFGFELDQYYDKFWVEDTDLSMQSLELNKKNYKLNQLKYIYHEWGGGGKDYQEKFVEHWNYFSNKWKGKVIKEII